MSQSSPNWNEGEDWQDETDAMPLVNEDRASQSLDRPEFQLSKPDESLEPQPPVAGDAGQSGAMEATPQYTAPHPSEITGAGSPQVQQAFASLGQIGQGPQPLPGYEDAYLRDQAQQESHVLHYLKSAGVKTVPRMDGGEEIATNENGQPLFHATKSEPFQGEDKRWYRRHRDEFGNVADVDMEATHAYHTDRDGNRYLPDGMGGRIVIGEDKAIKKRNEAMTMRRALQQQNDADQIQIENIKAEMAGPLAQYKALRNQSTGDEFDNQPVGKLERTIQNLGANPTGEALIQLQEANAKLDGFKAQHPEYDELKTQVNGANQNIVQRQQTMRDRRMQKLGLAAAPGGPGAASMLPAQPRVSDTPGDVSADDVEVGAAAQAAQARVSPYTGLARTYIRLMQQGVQTVEGQPIEDRIAALVAKSREPVPEPELPPAPKPEGPGALKNFAGSLVEGVQKREQTLKEGTFNAVAWMGEKLASSDFGKSEIGQQLGQMAAGTRDQLLSPGGKVALGLLVPGSLALRQNTPGQGPQQIADQAAQLRHWYQELEAGQFSPDNPFRAGGAKDKTGWVNPERQKGVGAGLADVLPDLGIIAAGQKIAEPVFVAEAAARGAAEAGDKGESRGIGALKEAAKTYGMLKLFGLFGSVGGRLMNRFGPAISTPLTRFLVGTGVHGIANVGADATIQALTGGNVVPQSPREWVSRGIFDIGFGGLGGAHEYGLPARLELAGKQVELMDAAAKTDTDPASLKVIAGKRAEAQKLIDQNRKLWEKMQAQKAAQPPQDGEQPGSEGAGGTPVPPNGPQPPAGPAEAVLGKMGDLDALQTQADALRRSGADPSDIQTTYEQAAQIHREFHETLKQATATVDPDIREGLAKAVGIDLGTHEAETLGDNATVGFSLAQAGHEMRNLYIEQPKEEGIARVAAQAGESEGVAQHLVDQYVGRRVANDLGDIAQGKAVDEEKLAELAHRGLVESGPDGTPHVTDDGLALLPEGQRRTIAAQPDKFRVSVTPGGPQDVGTTLFQGGHEKFANALRAKPVQGPRPAIQQHNFSVRFTDREGQEQSRTIAGRGQNREQAAADVVRRVEAAGNRVTDLEGERKATTPNVPADFAKDYTPEEQSAAKEVTAQFGRNQKLFAALGIKGVAFLKGETGAGLEVGTDGKLGVNAKMLLETFRRLKEMGVEPKEWAKHALTEELIHAGQRETAKRLGYDFREHYTAIRNDPTLPEPLLAMAREGYDGFDDLPLENQGAELERMVIQREWKGTIPEEIIKSIKDILKYLVGLQEKVGESPLLAESIKNVRAVIKDAEKAGAKPVTPAPAAAAEPAAATPAAPAPVAKPGTVASAVPGVSKPPVPAPQPPSEPSSPPKSAEVSSPKPEPVAAEGKPDWRADGPLSAAEEASHAKLSAHPDLPPSAQRQLRALDARKQQFGTDASPIEAGTPSKPSTSPSNVVSAPSTPAADVSKKPETGDTKAELSSLWPSLTESEVNHALDHPFTDAIRTKYDALTQDKKAQIDEWFSRNEDRLLTESENRWYRSLLEPMEFTANAGDGKQFGEMVTDGLRDIGSRYTGKDRTSASTQFFNDAAKIAQKHKLDVNLIRNSAKQLLAKIYGANAEEMSAAILGHIEPTVPIIAPTPSNAGQPSASGEAAAAHAPLSAPSQTPEHSLKSAEAIAAAAEKPATATEILHSGRDVRLTMPKAENGQAATHIEAIDTKGRTSGIIPVKEADILRGAGPYREVKAFRKDAKGKFVQVPGEIKAEDRGTSLGAAKVLSPVDREMQFSEDAKGQTDWMLPHTERLGYSSLNALLEKDPALFTRMAKAWRGFHHRESGKFVHDDAARAINKRLYGDSLPKESTQNALGDAIHDLSRISGTDREAPGGEGAGAKEQIEALVKWAGERGLLLDKLPLGLGSRADVGGEEHFVVQVGQRVLKATKDPAFGKVPKITSRGWDLQRATPLEYLQRLALQNQEFGDDVRLHGVAKDKFGHVNIVTSQPVVKGRELSPEETQKRFAEMGFEPLGEDGALYRESDNTLLTDDHPANSVESADGTFLPFDVNVMHPSADLVEAIRDAQPIDSYAPPKGQQVRWISEPALGASKVRGSLSPKEDESVRTGYDALTKRTGFPSVSISKLAEESGVPLLELKQKLLDLHNAGKVVLSTGDWSLSDEATRKGSIGLHGQKMLQVRFLRTSEPVEAVADTAAEEARWKEQWMETYAKAVHRYTNAEAMQNDEHTQAVKPAAAYAKEGELKHGAFEPLNAEQQTSLNSAYRKLVKETGFPHVTIAALAKESGVPVDQLKIHLLRENREGSATFAAGDWSLSNAETRAGMIPLRGDRELLVRLKPEQGTLFASAPKQTETPEFKRWFEKEGVRNKTGEPLVVYHGNETGPIDRIDRPIFLTTAKREAKAYSEITDVDEIQNAKEIDPSHSPQVVPKAFDMMNAWPIADDFVGEPNTLQVEDGTGSIFFWDGETNPVGDKNFVYLKGIRAKPDTGAVEPFKHKDRTSGVPEAHKPFVGSYFIRGKFFNAGDSRFAAEGAPGPANLIGKRLGGSDRVTDEWRKFLKERGFRGVQTFSDDAPSVRQYIVFDPTDIKSATDTPKRDEQEKLAPFYSQLTRTVENLPQATMTVEQAKAAIEKGAKKDEIKMSGILSDPLSPLYQGAQPDRTGKPLSDFLRRHGAPKTALDGMNPIVIGITQHDQVRRNVIAKLPVDVVAVLSANKITPEQLLSEPAVVGSRLSAEASHTVSLGLGRAMEQAIAPLRAKLAQTLSRGGDGEIAPALRASDLSQDEVHALLNSAPTSSNEAGKLLSDSVLSRATLAAKNSGGLVEFSEKRNSTRLAELLDAHRKLLAASGKRVNDKVTKEELRSWQIERQARVQDVVLDDKSGMLTHSELRTLRGLEQDEEQGILAPSSRPRLEELRARENEEGKANPTHFSQYQLPGADEGSYREHFVTWPKGATPDTSEAWNEMKSALKAMENLGFDSTQEAWEAIKNDASYADKFDIDPDKKPAIDAYRAAYREKLRALGWSDGHSQFSDIANPIVRARLNIRTIPLESIRDSHPDVYAKIKAEGRDAARIGFIEELQGPSKAEQEKMPKEIQSRIFPIGMKRSLRWAADEGVDMLGWTKGATQIERYDDEFRRVADKVEWTPKDADGDRRVTVTKDGKPVLMATERDGILRNASVPQANGKGVAETLGKAVAERLAKEESGSMSGKDISVGGQGLKHTYDVRMVSIANDLAKKFGVKVGEAKIESTPKKWTSEEGDTFDVDAPKETTTIHALPLPDALREQQRGGNALFATKVPKSFQDTYDSVVEEMKARLTKGDVSRKHDSARTIAANEGEQAKTAIRMDLGAAPKPTAEQQKDLVAARIVVEAGGNKANLADEHAKILASPSEKLRKTFLPIVDWAAAHFDRLHKATAGHRKMANDNYDRLKAMGYDVGKREDYVGRVTIRAEDPDEVHPLFGGGTGHGDNPKGSHKARAYDTIGDAVKAGDDPGTYGIHEADGRMVRHTEKLLQDQKFLDWAKNTAKATDGKPIIGELEERDTPKHQWAMFDYNAALDDWVTRGKAGKRPTPPKPEMAIPRGYAMVQMMGRPTVVHAQFAGLFRALYGDSAIRQGTLGRGLLKVAAMVKHGTLFGDTFHAGRMLLKGFASGAGAGYGRGKALLEYATKDLPRAVKAGEITEAQAAFAARNRPAYEELTKAGLNVAGVSDNLMEQAGLHIPGLSTYNNWLFQKLSRGIMIQGALKAFERNLPRFKTREDAARQTAKEMNEYFGNMQSQGIFKSKTLQDLARLVFLAPNWVESQARYEGRAYAQAIKHKGNILAGNSSRAMATGFVALLAANQVLNYVTRGQSTFENKEEDHKLDAWIPGGKRGFWFGPLEIAAEYLHAGIKYAAQHENPVDIAAHIASNKLSPLARGVKEAATGRDYAGRHFLNDTDRFRSAASDVLPIPLLGSGLIEKDPRQPLGYRMTRKPGAMEKQLLQSAGAKVTAAQSPRTQMFALAQPFRPDGGKTDSAGQYTELRRALDNDDMDSAKSEVQWLMGQGKTMPVIADALGIHKDGSIHPELFTGGKEREKEMLATLTPAQKTLYREAQADHVANARKFLGLRREVGKPQLAAPKINLSDFRKLDLPHAIAAFREVATDPKVPQSEKSALYGELQNKHAAARALN